MEKKMEATRKGKHNAIPTNTVSTYTKSAKVSSSPCVAPLHKITPALPKVDSRELYEHESCFAVPFASLENPPGFRTGAILARRKCMRESSDKMLTYRLSNSGRSHRLRAPGLHLVCHHGKKQSCKVGQRSEGKSSHLVHCRPGSHESRSLQGFCPEDV